jgi:monoterpene epsilon-lactone hydrolase
MASWQAHVLDLLLRLTVKRKLRKSPDLATVRAAMSGSRPLPVPPGVSFQSSVIGGVPGEWAVAAGTGPTAPTLLYLHGGGYFACSPLTHRPITAAFARAGFAVFVPDYRLAPEHPYPAALDDAHAVWSALRQEGRPAARMAVAGDSAGGGLALALMLRLRDEHQALPAAACLFSPWTDLAGTGASVTANVRRDALLWGPGLLTGAGFYIGGADAREPYISPLYAQMHGLPPLLFHVGEREILLDDSRRVADAAGRAGVRVQLRIWPVVAHVWQLAQSFVPEARESMAIASAFLHDAIGGVAAE